MNIFRPEIRTGLLVVFSLCLLIGAILYLGAPGVFVPMNTYWVYAENGAGLKKGNEVLLAGRRVGQVVKLYSPVPPATRPSPKLETLIEIQVNRSAVIYRGVRVYLTQNGLLGEMLIDFNSGRDDTGLAPDGATFIAERAPGLEQAAPMILEKLDPALQKVNETLDILQQTAVNLTKLTAENGELQTAIAEFRKFGGHLNQLTNETGPLRLSLENLEKMTSDEGKLGMSLENIRVLTAPDSSLSKTLKNAEAFTSDLANNEDIDKTLRNFRQASEKLNGTMAGLTTQFSSIAANLEQASDTVKRQPWRLIWPTTKKYPEEATPAVAREPERPTARRERVQQRSAARSSQAVRRRVD